MNNPKHIAWRRFVAPVETSTSITDLLRRLPELEGFQQAECLLDLPCIVLLGEPGMGKSDVMRTLEQAASARGRHVSFLDLGEYHEADLDRFFDQELRLVLERQASVELFLDSFDEGRIEITRLEQRVRGHLARLDPSRVLLRIACRTLDWPHAALDQFLRQTWRIAEESLHWRLAPLSWEDVELAARQRLDQRTPEFLAAVNAPQNRVLLGRPISLLLLLETWLESGSLPSTLREIFASSLVRLFSDHNRWLELEELLGNFGPTQRIAIGEPLAGAGVLAGRPSLWRGPRPATKDSCIDPDLVIGCRARSDDMSFDVTRDGLKETLQRGPFASRGSNEFVWSHRTLAEYLASRWLATSPATDLSLERLLTQEDALGGRRRVIPQLAEVVAWVAPQRPSLFRRLIEVDPVAIVRGDLSNVDEDDRKLLAHALLRVADAKEMHDDFHLREHLAALRYAGLSADLRPWLVDPERDFMARRLAIRIAEHCELDDLDDALRLVLSEPRLGNVGALAASALVASLARKQNWSAIESLLCLPPAADGGDPDPDDEIRADVLRALWPQHIQLSSLLEHLTPPKRHNYFGGYKSFLHGLFEEPSLPEEAVATVWEWYLAKATRDADWMHRLGERLARRLAPLFLTHDELAKSTVRALDDHHRALVNFSDFAAELRKILAADRARRVAVLRALAEEWSSLDAPVLVLWELGAREELPELVSWLTEERLRSSIPQMAQALCDWGDPGSVGILVQAAQSFPGLGWRAELHSGRSAAELAAEVRSKREAANAHRRPRPLDPPPADRVDIRLREALTQDPSAFVDLVFQMTLGDEGGHGYHFPGSLSSTPGWTRASAEVRMRIVDAAEAWIRRGDPATVEWIGTNRVDLRATAGIRAWLLLLEQAPERLAAVESAHWRRWASVILLSGDTNLDHDDLARLRGSAAQAAPVELAEALRQESKRKDRGLPIALYAATEAWCEPVRDVLLELLDDEARAADDVQDVAECLLQHGVGLLGRVREWHGRGVPAERLVALLAAHIRSTLLDECWNTVNEILQGDSTIAHEAFLRAARGSFASEGGAAHSSSPRVTSELAERLIETFPPDRDRQVPEGGHLISEEESAIHMRDGALRRLERFGDWDAVAELSRLRERFPEHDTTLGLRWRVQNAADAARRLSWAPLPPKQILEIVGGKTGAVYLSARFGTELRARLREALERRFTVVVTENEARPLPPLEAIDQDVQGTEVLVQGIEWKHGLGDRGQPGGSWLEQEHIVARLQRKPLVVGILENTNDEPADVREYVGGLNRELISVSSGDIDTLVHQIVEGAQRAMKKW